MTEVQILTADLFMQYKTSYFETLSALVVSTPLPDKECRSMLDEVNTQGGTVFVMLDDDETMIIGTVTVYVLRHLVRGGVYTAHVEEICVHPDYQGQGIGSRLLEKAIDRGRKQKCYKAILNCEDHSVGWYEKFGFEKKEVEMKMYL